MIFLSWGHGPNDVGATGNGYREIDINKIQFEATKKALLQLGIPFKEKYAHESLAAYTNRIQSGSGSVLLEYHCDWSSDPNRTGTSAWMQRDADKHDLAFCKKIVAASAQGYGITNRGVFDERKSFHGSLRFMRESGLVCLSECGFISKPGEMEKVIAGADCVGMLHARILQEFDAMF